jgi:7,8-dihydropterin-6-yl-methyl-4-(beta-D-ribofuranosyl)aminobenzene 5'-phosphate synthase
VRITILYDNYLWDQRLSADWGFAALVEAGPHILLFDTGGNADIFMGNLETLGIDPKSIEAVVISHAHGDHIGGLLAFLAQADHPTVYLPDSFPSGLKERVRQEAKLVEVSGPTPIFPGITTIGPLNAGSLEEQGLLVDLGDEVAILTGCAHPGVASIVQSGLDTLAAQQDGARKPVALLVGGFHLLEASHRQVEAVIARLQELGVRQVVPTHCTGDSAIATFASVFGDNYIPGGAGQVIEIP